MNLPAAGLLAIDKEAGWTSHDVVAALRPVLGTPRVGHAGTLDPFATGVLEILYGRATRLADRLHRLPKTYLAEVVLGEETTTDDATGEPLAPADVPALSDDDVRAVFEGFVGTTLQRPPAYAAIRVGGERAYVRARRGEAVEMPLRTVVVYGLTLVERDARLLRILVRCGSGTYVRSLGRDIGRALGTRAHLGALRRLESGGLRAEDALTVGQAREFAAADGLASRIYAVDDAALDASGDLVVDAASHRLLAAAPRPRTIVS